MAKRRTHSYRWRALIELILLPQLLLCVALMLYLPRDWALVVARGWIRVGRRMMRRAEGVGLRNLELVFPEKSSAERQAILQASYEVLARHLVAFSKSPNLTPERIHSMFEFEELHESWQKLRNKGAQGIGTILVCAHFGYFELLAQARALVEGPMAIVARPLGFPRTDQFWNGRRRKFGNQIIARSGAFQEIVSTLRLGVDVAILADQNVKARHAVFVNLFGIPAATTKSVALAAIRTGAPILFVVCVETSPERFKLLYSPIGVSADFPGTVDEKVIDITASMNRALEQAVRAHPEQWMWIHRRYKTRPPGEKEQLYDSELGIADAS